MKKQIETIKAMPATLEQWSEIRALYLELAVAGRRMVLLGVKCLQLKDSLPYGEFNRELAAQCPEIHHRSLYRAMQATKNVMEALSCARCVTTGALAQMAEALEGTGRPELLAEIDALVQGKSGRQLVLDLKTDQKATAPTKEAEHEENCLHHFETHKMGPEHEARWRMDAESGEISWAQCWQYIKGGELKGGTRPDADPATLLGLGLIRLKSWATESEWGKIKEKDRPKLLAAWETAIDSLHPELRAVAVRKLNQKARP